MARLSIALLVILVVILIIAVGSKTEWFQVNKLILLIYLRGLTFPNRFWWRVSDIVHDDLAGAQLFHSLKDGADPPKIFRPLYLLGHKNYLVLDIDHVKEILDNSPWPFGVGQLKYNFFKSFMPENVGVSTGCPWKMRRAVNEQVLFTDKLHPLLINIGLFLQKTSLPHNFETFNDLAQKIAMLMVFGEKSSATLDARMFKMFVEANKLGIFRQKSPDIPSYQYFVQAVDNSIQQSQNSMIAIAEQLQLSRHELLQQAPHWLFPINGVLTVSLPRILALLASYPEMMLRVRKELQSVNSLEQLWSTPKRSTFLRRAIMETLRLNNTVVSLFRTLLVDYTFKKSGIKFDKSTNFLILIAGFLRDPQYFPDPDQFIPDRWLDEELQDSYANLIWSQGPQRCPGKELSINLLELGVWNILTRTSSLTVSGVTRNLNPFSLHFAYN